MRKSLFVCLMMFAAFSAEKVSAYYRNWDLFGIQKGVCRVQRRVQK